jgi:hypothetical protein
VFGHLTQTREGAIGVANVRFVAGGGGDIVGLRLDLCVVVALDLEDLL